MSMMKKIEIDGKAVVFKASAAILRIYRIKFQRDIYKDLSVLEKSISIISRRRSDAFIADSPPIGVALILDYHAMGQKPCPLFFIFYKRESYNNLCISRYQ